MSWVAPTSSSSPTGYPGDLKFPGRCDRFYPNFLQVGDQNLAFGLHFCDQDGGTPLESDPDQGAGEEASSPAVDVRDAWREAKDFMFIAENARSRHFDC